MKILILQLTRLGDIFSTWPTVRALRRQYPSAKIHMLVRPRFASACEGLSDLDQVIEMPMMNVFRALLKNDMSDKDCLKTGMEELNDFLMDLQEENYDEIINLSFSPSSSFLVKCIESNDTKVKGYSRHEDAFLRIDDDPSAYFYAQTGVSKYNRFHVNDLFAEVAGVELQQEDYTKEVAHQIPPLVREYIGDEEYIVVHLAASTTRKSLSQEKWMNVMRRLSQQIDHKIVLIGAEIDQEIAKNIQLTVRGNKVISLVGKTKLLDLFPILKDSSLLVGLDSAPIHIASLTGTPTYNLSNSYVRFWETGPKATGSRIRGIGNFEALGSDVICNDIQSMLENDIPSDEMILVKDPFSEYEYVENNPHQLFCWNMIRAIYLGEDFPVPYRMETIEGFKQLQELNAISLQQLTAILRKEQNEENERVLQNVDQLVDKLLMMVPELAPVVDWYQTEKLRIGPLEKKQIVASYCAIHENLAKILSVYTGDNVHIEENANVNERTIR